MVLKPNCFQKKLRLKDYHTDINCEIEYQIRLLFFENHTRKQVFKHYSNYDYFAIRYIYLKSTSS